MNYQTKNTRLAASLMALGFAVDDNIDFTGAVVNYNFSDGSKLHGYSCSEYDRIWRDTEWPKLYPEHPFSLIRKAAEARDWIVSRVVHGNHNLDMDVPTVSTFKTRNLNLASCLVADGYYLLRLDLLSREFHFPADAEVFHLKWKNFTQGDAISWQTAYLRKFNWLLRCIRNQMKMPEQNNARQGKQQCVASVSAS